MSRRFIPLYPFKHLRASAVATPITILFLIYFHSVSPLTTFAQIESRDLSGQKIAPSLVKELPPSSKRFALLVGVSEYKDKRIPQLIAPSNDADVLADALVKYAGFPKDQVIVLATNKSEEYQPEGNIILEYISTLTREAGKDGLFLLAFSGHGYEVDGQAFFLGSDARLVSDMKVLKRTCVSWSDMTELINDADVGNVILLLDACRNDPRGGKSIDRPNQVTQIYERGINLGESKTKRQKAWVKMLATQKGEFAYEDPSTNLGFFMSAFVDAIKGEAADEDGIVTIARLRRYVEEKVPARAKMKSRKQKPVVEVYAYNEEQLVIAITPSKKPQIAKVEKPIEKIPEKPAENPALVELNEWIKTRKSQKIDDYKDFLNKYPSGNFSEEARNRVREFEELMSERQDWLAINTSARIDDLKDFLKKHPRGIFSEEAKNKIRELEEAAKPKLPISPASSPPTTLSASQPSSTVQPATEDALHFNKGDELFNKNRFSDAEKEYREAIKINPNNATYYGKLGITLYNQRNFKEAELIYKKAISLNPYSADFFFNLGLALLQREKFAHAETEFRKALKINPNVGDFHSSLCYVLSRQNKLRDAEVECKKAIELESNNASYHFNLGNLFIKQKNYIQAEKEYRTASQLEPGNAFYKEKLEWVRRLF